jgi:hypothetical protein
MYDSQLYQDPIMGYFIILNLYLDGTYSIECDMFTLDYLLLLVDVIDESCFDVDDFMTEAMGMKFIEHLPI